MDLASDPPCFRTGVLEQFQLRVDDFVELDEVVYMLIFFWLLMAGPGRYSLDHLLARSLGIERVLSNR